MLTTASDEIIDARCEKRFAAKRSGRKVKPRALLSRIGDATVSVRERKYRIARGCGVWRKCARWWKCTDPLSALGALRPFGATQYTYIQR